MHRWLVNNCRKCRATTWWTWSSIRARWKRSLNKGTLAQIGSALFVILLVVATARLSKLSRCLQLKRQKRTSWTSRRSNTMIRSGTLRKNTSGFRFWVLRCSTMSATTTHCSRSRRRIYLKNVKHSILRFTTGILGSNLILLRSKKLKTQSTICLQLKFSKVCHHQWRLRKDYWTG